MNKLFKSLGLVLLGVAMAMGQGTQQKVIIQTSQFTREVATNETALGWRTKLGVSGGSGTGSVSSVALTMPAPFTVTGSPITESGTFTVGMPSQNANTFYGGPTVGVAFPSFRSLVAGDIPGLPASQITSGIFSTARQGAGTADGTTFLRGDGFWAVPPTTGASTNYVNAATNDLYNTLHGQITNPTNVVSASNAASLNMDAMNIRGVTKKPIMGNALLSMSDTILYQTVTNMLQNGAYAHGYNLIAMDDGWQNGARVNGYLAPNMTNFPNGLLPSVSMMHSNGFKAGIYTAIGPLTCLTLPGSQTNWYRDSYYFATNGFDWVKLDGCSGCTTEACMRQYAEDMSLGMQAGGHPMWLFFNTGTYYPWMPGHINSVRISGDPSGSSDAFLRWTNFYYMNLGENFTNTIGDGAGFFHDVGGFYTTGISSNMLYSELAILALYNSPLIAVGFPNDSRMGALTNASMIAIDQDVTYRPVVLRSTNDTTSPFTNKYHIASRRLEDNSVAVLFVNGTTNASQTHSINFNQIGFNTNDVVHLFDVGQRSFIGYYTNGFTNTVPAMSSTMYRVYPQSKPSFEYGTNYLSEKFWLMPQTNGATTAGSLQVPVYRNKSPFNNGTTMSMGGSSYPVGLGLHAWSSIAFELDNGADEIHADVGLDDNAQGTAIAIQFYTNGILAFDSGTITNNGTGGNSPSAQAVNLSAAGVNVLRIEVVSRRTDTNVINNCYGDIANLSVFRGAPTHVTGGGGGGGGLPPTDTTQFATNGGIVTFKSGAISTNQDIRGLTLIKGAMFGVDHTLGEQFMFTNNAFWATNDSAGDRGISYTNGVLTIAQPTSGNITLNVRKGGIEVDNIVSVLSTNGFELRNGLSRTKLQAMGITKVPFRIWDVINNEALIEVQNEEGGGIALVPGGTVSTPYSLGWTDGTNGWKNAWITNINSDVVRAGNVISTNVATLNGTNVFTGTNDFTGQTIFDGIEYKTNTPTRSYTRTGSGWQVQSNGINQSTIVMTNGGITVSGGFTNTALTATAVVLTDANKGQSSVAIPSDATKYLDGTGVFTVPAGGGGGAGTNVNVGVLNTETNSGVVPVLWAPVNSSSAAGTSNGYVFRVGGTSSAVSSNLMYWTGISDGAGASTNPRVIIPNGVQFSPLGNSNYTAYAAGTAYTLTATPAAIDMGTTDPAITLSQPGTYWIRGTVRVLFSGSTYIASQTVDLKFRRTNNTAADVSPSVVSLEVPVLSTFTGGDSITLDPVEYTTANANDALTLFGSLSATPSAGSVTITGGSIVAERIR